MPGPRQLPQVQKSKRVRQKKKTVEKQGLPELIGIARGLEFTGFSYEAVKQAEEELWGIVEKLAEEGDGELAQAVRLLVMLRKRDFEGIRNFGH